MSATRLVILGALKLIQPTSGYQLRQELVRWEADQWAPIAYGSIYHLLRAMEREGLLTVQAASERKGGSKKNFYTLTSAGEKEYYALLEDAWLSPRPAHDPLQIPLNFSPDIPPDIFNKGLRLKIQTAKETIGHLEMRASFSPSHVKRNMELVIAQQKTFIQWAENQLH